MGEKHRMTHTQTFFPESLILCAIGRSPGLRIDIDLPTRRSEQWYVDNINLYSLQLRVQR
jgi:hypothetical protein